MNALKRQMQCAVASTETVAGVQCKGL